MANVKILKAIKEIKTGRIVTGYVVQDSLGNTKKLSNKAIKELINNGVYVDGLKIDKAGRLIKDRKSMPGNMQKSLVNNKYGIKILRGSEIANQMDRDIVEYSRRNYVKQIINFCKNPQFGRILVIHGVRRTGKTVQMIHAILDCMKSGIDSNRLYYLEVPVLPKEKISADDLDKVLNKLIDINLCNGRKPIIFIDEITYVNNIIPYLKNLQDILSMNATFIVQGTDSFVFSVAARDVLYDRYEMIHTTMVSYAEIKRLKPNIQFKDYIDGMTLYPGVNLERRQNKSNIKVQIDQATIGNILGTISRSKGYFQNFFDFRLKRLQKIKEQDIIYIVYCLLLQQTSPKKYGAFLNQFKTIGKDKIEFLRQMLGYYDSSITSRISELSSKNKDDIYAVLNALETMDIARVVYNEANGVELDDNTGCFKSVTDQEICCMQQGLIQQVCKVQNLDTQSINGILTENLVLQSLFIEMEQGRKQIDAVKYLKYSYNDIQREIDAIVKLNLNNDQDSCYTLIEVKHDSSIKPEYVKNLNVPNQEMVPQIRGKIHRKIVVYNGISCEKYGVQFVNLEEFLLDPCKWL